MQKLDTLHESEVLAIRDALSSDLLMSALRKVWADDAMYWHEAMKQAALSPRPNVEQLVQYAARESAAETAEDTLRKAVGL